MTEFTAEYINKLRKFIDDKCVTVVPIRPVLKALDEIERLQTENERLRAVYPRAFKLIDKGKYFIVISFDEPYFIQAYSLIREQEIKIGRWDAHDEVVYQYYALQAPKGGE